MVSEKKGINQFSVKNKTEEIAQRSFNLSYICFLINISKLYLHVKIQFFSNSYFSILNSACFLSSMCHGFKKRKKNDICLQEDICRPTLLRLQHPDNHGRPARISMQIL